MAWLVPKNKSKTRYGSSGITKVQTETQMKNQIAKIKEQSTMESQTSSGMKRLIDRDYHKQQNVPDSYFPEWEKTRARIRQETFGPDSPYAPRKLSNPPTISEWWKRRKVVQRQQANHIKLQRGTTGSNSINIMIKNAIRKLLGRLADDIVDSFDWLRIRGGGTASLAADSIDALIYLVESGVFAMFLHEEAVQLTAFMVKDAMCMNDMTTLMLRNEIEHKNQVFYAATVYKHWRPALLYTAAGYESYITAAMLIFNVARTLYPTNYPVILMDGGDPRTQNMDEVTPLWFE
jgi:hypothetical protein